MPLTQIIRELEPSNETASQGYKDVLQYALEDSRIGFWSWDIQKDEMFMSERVKEVFKISFDGNTTQDSDFRERVHPDYRDQVQQDFSVFRNPETMATARLEAEYPFRQETGGYIWVRLTGRMITDKNGNPEKMAGSMLDISDLIAEREKYRKNEDELRLIFDSVPARIWYKDAHNKILRLNAKAASSMNLDVEEAEGADTYELFPAMARKYHDDDLAVINSGKPLLGIIEEYTPIDGEHGWVRTDKIPYTDPETGENYVFVSSMDVTLEKNAENIVRESEERFQLAARGASVGIWDWPVNGTDPFWVSLLFCSDLGLPQDRHHIKDIEHFLSLVHEDERAELSEAFDAHFKDQKPFSVECRFEVGSHNLRWFKVSGQAKWNENGQPVRMIGAILDINDLKEAQLNLEKYTRELESANNDLDHFVYVASHDLKAPLRGIDNLACWIQEDIKDQITPDIANSFDSLRGRVSRMETLLADILSFARAGKQLSSPERINTGEVIDEVTSWVKVPKSFTIKHDTSFPDIITVRSVFEHICLNLISNAVKHHDRDNGQILLACYDRIDYFEFTIIDDGPGIPKEYHNYVFEIFKKLRARDAVEGSGIGLAIVKKMVESIGGSIWIKQNKNNSGTAFHFSIPKNLHYAAALSRG